MINSLTWLLDAANPVAEGVAEVPAAPGMMEMLPNIAIMVVMVAVFYFLLIRPQRKKDKAVKDMLSQLSVGNRVCTIGGIYGTVTALKDDTVTVAVGAAKTSLVFARWGIRSVEDAPLENDAEPSV